jgi:hypothetical protein
VETLTIKRSTADIRYAIARGHADTPVRFDNLRFGPGATTTTDARGTFALPYLPAGTYFVQVVPGPGQSVTSPGLGRQQVDLAAGAMQSHVDFGLTVEPSRWQNLANRFDVNGDGTIAPLDALVIINELNRSGVRSLGGSDPTPPYLDVNGDYQITPRS